MRSRGTNAVIALGMLVGAAFVAAGCGGGSTGGSGGSGGGEKLTEVVIASDLPLTGSARAQTESMVQAIEMAIAETNAARTERHDQYLQAFYAEATAPRRGGGYGIGLPGRAWALMRPVWVSDAATDEGFTRADAAAEAGIRKQDRILKIGQKVREMNEAVAALILGVPSEEAF